MAIVDQDGVLLEFNQRFKDNLPNIRIDLSLFDILQDSSELQIAKKDLRSQANTITVMSELSPLQKFELTFSWLHYSGSEIYYLLTLNNKKELTYNAENIQQLINNISDTIFVKDLNGVYIIANNWHARTLGKNSSTDVIGKRDLDLIDISIADKNTAEELEILQTGKPLLDNKEIKVVNEQTRYYSFTKIPFYDYKGNIIGVMGVGRDITLYKTHKQHQKKISSGDETADELKSAFLANLSHEIRTPLNSILGFSQFLKENPDNIEKQDKYLDIIHNNGEQLLTLLNDMLDVSLIESNQISINKREFRINGLLEQLYSNFRHLINSGSLAIDLKLVTQLPNGEDYIFSDDYRLHQVLSKLIGNAIKFTHKGTVEFGYKVKGNDIVFYIADTGIGMSEEIKGIIFKRFRQADESITRKYGGTGLGLSISQGLVKKLGGEIWVDSAPQKGSTFYFNIKRKK